VVFSGSIKFDVRHHLSIDFVERYRVKIDGEARS
jgi:hypothetical protein